MGAMRPGGRHRLAVIRPALELALGVARMGMTEVPLQTPPGPVRPLLHFAKLSERAMATLRDSVERDGEFRRRVAESADEAVIGRLAYVWLTRPEGWAEELEAAELARAAVDDEEADDRAERSARRRLVAVEAALARAVAETEEARRVATEANEELAGQRQARRQGEQDRLALAADAEEAGRRAAGLRGEVEEANTARQVAAEQLDDARLRIRHLVAERDDATARAEQAEVAGDDARTRLKGRHRATAEVSTSLARAVEEAAGAARHLGSALAQAAGILDGAGAGHPGDSRIPGTLFDTGDRDVIVESAAGRDRPPVATALRRPVPLPPGLFDDSDEAAGHLVGVAGIVLLVDGYNVSLAGWPDDELAAQRQYLLDRLATLAARRGPAVWVIFDGAEYPLLPPPGTARPAVRMVFSKAGVDADEVIIARVDQLPASTPVLVATSDRRVADEVRRRGANVISTPQMLAVLGRQRP